MPDVVGSSCDEAVSGGGERPPLVSIVTPSFNQARYLRRCIDSVLKQDYPRIEYRVLDGGSTDGSLEILSSYGERVTWTSGPDGGQTAAINTGFRRARGEILAWLNSDDELLPGAVSAAVESLLAAPDAGMVHGRAWFIDVAGERIRPYPSYAFARRDLSRKCYVCQPTVFVRRSAVDAVGLLDESLDICMDYEWWLRIGRAMPIAFCDRYLACSRQYGETKTSSRRLRALVEAGRLMHEHFDGPSWRWAAKWVHHRWTLDRRRFVVPVVGWASAVSSARRYRRACQRGRVRSAERLR